MASELDLQDIKMELELDEQNSSPNKKPEDRKNTNSQHVTIVKGFPVE